MQRFSTYFIGKNTYVKDGFMYSSKQVNQLWRQVNYLNKTCGIPINTLSKQTKIHYQYVLNFYI